MSQDTKRSWTKTLVIVLLSPVLFVHGFSIRQGQEQKEIETPGDLIAEESALLEVKNDMKRPNDINTFKLKTDETLYTLADTGTIKDKLQDSTSTRVGKSNNVKTINSKGVSSSEPSSVPTRSLSGNAHKSIVDFTTTPIFTNTETNYPKITTENEDGQGTLSKIVKSGSHFRNNISSRQTSKFTSDEGLTATDVYTTTPIVESKTDIQIMFSKNPIPKTSIKLNDVGMQISENEYPRKNTQNPELQVTSTPLQLYSNNVGISKSFANKSDDFQFKLKDMRLTKSLTLPVGMLLVDDNVDNRSTATKSVIIEEIFTFPSYTTSDITQEMATYVDMTQNNSEIFSNKKGVVKTDSTIERKLEFTKLDSPKRSELTRKKYTDIERKHPTTADYITATNNYDTEITKGEASQTSYVFDKSFGLSTLLSLGHLKSKEIKETNKQLHNQATLDPLYTLNPTENELTITAPIASVKLPYPRIGMVSSMRAGFLDYSGKASTHETTKYESNKERLGTEYESLNIGQNTRLEPKKSSVVGFQSQLSQDAIKEELLEEEMLNDHVLYLENTKRNRNDREDSIDNITSVTNVSIKVDKQLSSTSTSKEGVFENTLSVQPINHDQGKNMDLYVVSPNYKPMKRIEVQPAKLFVRDPDDNSWRNMSISSLGIVFKPKNSSKSFTQVLKNKTETELSSFADRDNKAGLPDLRERLEKIAEVRKSKKKRVNKNGDTVYSDYEENNNSAEYITTIKMNDTFSADPTKSTTVTTTNPPSTPSSVSLKITQSTAAEEETMDVTKGNNLKLLEHDTLTALTPPKKPYNIAEYYDTTDEYDADYLTLSKIDIKKFTIPATTQTTVTLPAPSLSKPLQIADRKPTVQYFPPRVTPTIYDIDNDFQNKINLYEHRDKTKLPQGAFQTVPPTKATYEVTEEVSKIVKPIVFPLDRLEHMNLNKHLYLTEIPQVTTSHSGFDINDENFNRASYVIKHYRDFVNAAARDDDDKYREYVALTEAPIHGSTLDEIANLRRDRIKPTIVHDYDYTSKYRKNILNRFVNDFNQNNEKHKADFPILLNKSMDHRPYQGNGNVLSSSNAFIKSFYGSPETATKPSFSYAKPCDPNCEKLTVELSPAYELHYYVPEQEEKQMAELRPRTVSYRYRLEKK